MAGIAEETSHEPPITSGSPLFATVGSPNRAGRTEARSTASLPISPRPRRVGPGYPSPSASGSSTRSGRPATGRRAVGGGQPGGQRHAVRRFCRERGMGDVRRRRPHGAAASPGASEPGSPRWPRLAPAAMNAHGQVVASLFPKTCQESMLFMGMHGEVWLEPGVGLDGRRDAALAGRRAQRPGRAGAGRGQRVHAAGVRCAVQAVRRGPRRPAQDEPGQRLPGTALRGGLCAVDPPELPADRLWRRGHRRYLCHHPQVASVHLTGSDKTYDAIARDRRGRGCQEGSIPAAAGQTRHRRARRRQPCDRRPRAMD